MQQALTVSQLNQYIRMRLERDEVLQQVCLSGELSNVTLHRSGHIYLKLKDEQSVISGVMFRFQADKLSFVPREGQRVIVYGSISVYEPSGSYQIKISVMQLDGRGQLFAAFEELKAKLKTEGLFEPEHKKQLPAYPKTIGVITSPTGAAIRDIIRVCSRRYPLAEILLYPALVQGEGAAESLREAVEWFDANRACDVLIIGRGGGSIEDLWAFNDEALAYAVYSCDIPTVSAVGHEIDFTICDFVADKRAATPSMAAELVTPDLSDFSAHITETKSRLHAALKSKTDLMEMRLNAVRSNPLWWDETRLLSRFIQKNDIFAERLSAALRELCRNKAVQFEKNVIKLEMLSPLATLARGYASVFSGGKVLSDFHTTAPGDSITVNLKDTTAHCRVEKVEVN